jgi:hypothetical protein
MPSRAPEAPVRKRLVAMLFGVAGLGAAYWSLSARAPAPSQVETSAPKTAAAPSATETAEAMPSSSPVEALPIEAAPTPLPEAQDEELPPPVMPSALPLSPAKPPRAPAKTASKPLAPKPKAAAPASKRKAVDDGF